MVCSLGREGHLVVPGRRCFTVHRQDPHIPTCVDSSFCSIKHQSQIGVGVLAASEQQAALVHYLIQHRLIIMMLVCTLSPAACRTSSPQLEKLKAWQAAQEREAA